MTASTLTPQSPAPSRTWRRLPARAALVAACLLVAAAIPWWLWPALRVHGINALLWVEQRARPQHVVATQRALEAWLPASAVVIAGDSFAVMLPARWVDARAAGFGLSGALVEHVRGQLRDLHSLRSARALVLLAGSNDVVHRPAAVAESELRALLAGLPANLPVLLCTIPPVNPLIHRERPPEAIAQLNQRWQACAEGRPRTRLVRVESVLADGDGRLRKEFHQGDGLHLNAEGNRRLAALLREILAEIAPAGT